MISHSFHVFFLMLCTSLVLDVDLQNLPSRTLEFHEGKEEIIPVSSVCMLWGTLNLVGELSEGFCVYGKVLIIISKTSLMELLFKLN